MQIESLSASELEAVQRDLVNLLRECVHGGASVGFLAPLPEPEAIEYWISIAPQVQSGSRTVLVAREDDQIVGSGQLVFESKRNARHRAEVCKVIRVHKPDLVFCQDPWREYQIHPDHRVAGWSALDGVIAARDHLFFPEQLTKGLTHHRVSRVLLFGTADPNVWFDITSTMKTKIHALQAHESQVSDFTRLAERMHGFAAATGKAWGLEKAEAFRYLELA